MTKKNQLFNWIHSKAASENSELWIALASFFETILFLPVDPFIIFFTLAQPKKYLRFAATAAVVSAFGGSIAYFIGAFVWHIIGSFLINTIISPALFESLSLRYQTHQSLVVFFGAFLPLPFKAVTLSAGVCKIPFLNFLVTLSFARMVRFFLVAWITKEWGTLLQGFIDRHARSVITLICAKVFILFICAYYFK